MWRQTVRIARVVAALLDSVCGGKLWTEARGESGACPGGFVGRQSPARTGR